MQLFSVWLHTNALPCVKHSLYRTVAYRGVFTQVQYLMDVQIPTHAVVQEGVLRRLRDSAGREGILGNFMGRTRQVVKGIQE